MDVITELSVEEFQALVGGLEGRHLVVRFTAPWCAPCRRIEPMCHAAFAELPGNFLVAELDIEGDARPVFGVHEVQDDQGRAGDDVVPRRCGPGPLVHSRRLGEWRRHVAGIRFLRALPCGVLDQPLRGALFSLLRLEVCVAPPEDWVTRSGGGVGPGPKKLPWRAVTAGMCWPRSRMCWRCRRRM